MSNKKRPAKAGWLYWQSLPIWWLKRLKRLERLELQRPLVPPALPRVSVLQRRLPPASVLARASRARPALPPERWWQQSAR